MAVWEALASGTPVIVSQFTGFERHLREAGGTVLQLNTAAELMAALSQYLYDEEYQALQSQCARRIAASHSWTTYQYRMLNMLWRALNEGKGAA